MALDFTVDTRIIASVRRRGMVPSTQETLDDDDILELANEELQSYVAPLLLGVREEFLVAVHDITTTNSAHYNLPPRAVGRELRNVLWQTNVNGNQNYFLPLPRIDPEREWEFGNLGYGGPYGYKFENDQVVLLSPPSAGGTLRLQYFIRPNQLTLAENCRQIDSISGDQVNYTGTAPSWVSNGTLCDIVRGKPGFALSGMDLEIASSGSGYVQFTENVPSDVEVGDWLCLEQTSPIAQIPVELFPLLAERTCYKVYEALGNPKSEQVLATCNMMEKQAARLLSPRSQGSARPIVPRYSGRRGWWGPRGGGYGWY